MRRRLSPWTASIFAGFPKTGAPRTASCCKRWTTPATPIYIEYRISHEWFDGIEDVIDELEAHLATHPKVVVVLVERLLVRLNHADVDDSGGGLMLALKRLEPLYAEAGRAVGEDPVSLGKRVADLALDFDFAS